MKKVLAIFTIVIISCLFYFKAEKLGPEVGGLNSYERFSKDISVGQIIVDGKLSSLEYPDRNILRRLFAWSKGDVGNGRCLTHLDISRVVKGSLPDDYVNRPVGTRYLRIFLFGSAAVALQSENYSVRNISGQWKLRRLPDGTFAVMDIKDTPCEVDIDKELLNLRWVNQKLNGDDHEALIKALNQIAEKKTLKFIPHLLPLLDNKEVIEDIFHIHVSPKIGPHRTDERKFKTTVSKKVGSILVGLTSRLRGRNSPSYCDSSKVWKEWWEKLLQTEPFPEVQIVPGELTEIPVSLMNQNSPELSMSANGDAAIIPMTMLNKSVRGITAGIQYVPLDKPNESFFVHKGWSQHVNFAWGKEKIGMVWPKTGGCLFLSLDKSGKKQYKPLKHSLKDAWHISLCEDGDSWQLAYNTKSGNLFVRTLNRNGQLVGQEKQLLKVNPITAISRSSCKRLCSVKTPSGLVLAYSSETILSVKNGLFLLFLDKELNILKKLKVSPPKALSHSWFPQLSWNGSSLCIAWVGLDNHGWRVFFRIYNADGVPQTEVTEVATGASRMSLVSDKEGFVLVWSSSKQTPNQIRTVRLSNKGELGKTFTVYNGKARLYPIDAGMDDEFLKVMFFDRSIWPYRMMLKKVRKSSFNN